MKKLMKRYYNIETLILISCVVLMGAILFLQVIMRFVFSSPLKWVEELARYLQIWITFLGIGYGIRNGSHIGMSFVKDRLPQVMQIIVGIICKIAEIVVFLILIKYSIEFITHQNVVSTAMRLPMIYVYCVIPIGAVIDIGYNIVDLIEIIKESKKKGENK